MRCILTKAAEHFVTPLSAGALVGERVFTDLFDRGERIRRRPYPARARNRSDRGRAGDRRPDGQDGRRPRRRSRHRRAAGDRRENSAGAGDEPADVGEQSDAAQSGAARRRRRRARRPERRRDGGEQASAASAAWPNRWRSPPRWRNCLDAATRSRFKGKRVLVTSGPTHEPIDPVRYIANRSSGKQGHAIAAAAARAGAEVTLVSGPVNVPDPPGVNVVHVETAREMLQAVERGAAGRCRDLRRRGRRLARRQCRRTEDQEEAGPSDAGIVAGRKSRHPRDHRATKDRSGRNW